jgi:uncharacterized protein
MIMQRYLAVATIFFALSLSGLAQQAAADSPATKEDVQRYLDAMQAHQMMQQMAEAMAQPMHKMVHEEYEKEKDKLPPDFESRMNKVMDDMMQGMPWDEMLAAMVPTYEKHLTHGDVDALVAFYTSPTGKKILREMPKMMAESMDAMMPIMRRHMEATGRRVQREVAVMKREVELGAQDNAPAKQQK